MSRRQTMLRLILGGMIGLFAWPSIEIAVQAAELPQARDAVEGQICVLAGTVVDADTGRGIPYFYLRQMRSNSTLVEYLETDEQGRFSTTAPKGSDRYFVLERSRRGTYIIDREAQQQLDLQPFRGVVDQDKTDLVIEVKVWPVTTLTGRVVDGSGRPVANASLCIHCDVPAVKTDAEGAFRIEVAPTARDFDVFAISEDMGLAGQVHLEAGSTTTTIVVEPTASYRGRVIDVEGRPVGPFRFLVGLRPNASSNDCLQREIQAAADGTFVIESLSPGAKYYLWWFPDENVNQTLGEPGDKWVNLPEQGLDEPIEIVVTQYLNNIDVRVVDANGIPLEDTRVTVLTRRMQSQAQNRLGRGVRTDSDGRASLRGLANGQAQIYAYKTGFRQKRIWTATNVGDLEIALRSSSEPGLCQVQVVDDDYQPVANVAVGLSMCLLESGELLSSRTAVTDADGRAQFPLDVYDETLRAQGTICCDVEGYDLAYNSTSNRADDQITLVLHESGPPWSGRLVDPQQNPVVAAELHLTSMAQRVKTPQRVTSQSLDQSFYYEPLPLVARSDQEGRFTLSRFSRKDFARVMVKAPGFGRDELDFSPDEEGGRGIDASGIGRVEGHVFQLSPDVATLDGVVIDASSGESLAETRISLKRPNGSDREVTTDSNGLFHVEDLESGEYVPGLEDTQDAGDAKYVCVPELIAAEPGQTIQATIQVREGVVLKGRLVDTAAQGSPTGERAYLDARLESGHTVASSRIGPYGRWELLVAPGDYRLYYVQLVEDVGGFMASQRPLSVTIEDRDYDEMVLEADGWRSLSLRPVSLIGKTLPSLEGLVFSGVEFNARGRAILLCFFDMQQRPSRNCLMELNRRAQELKDEGIVVFAIETTSVPAEVLAQWVQDNDISFRTGTIDGDDELVRFNWGVRALPWLILTDANHRVVAEGLSVAQAEQQIEAAETDEE